MELKKLEVLNELTGKTVNCICVNYEAFIKDCYKLTVPRYRDFKCNPKNQFDKKATSVMQDVFYDKHFFPDLFYTRLNKKQCICNSQIDYMFELLNKDFLKVDDIRQTELTSEVLNACLLPEVDYVMIYIGMNR